MRQLASGRDAPVARVVEGCFDFRGDTDGQFIDGPLIVYGQRIHGLVQFVKAPRDDGKYSLGQFIGCLLADWTPTGLCLFQLGSIPKGGGYLVDQLPVAFGVILLKVSSPQWTSSLPSQISWMMYLAVSFTNWLSFILCGGSR